MTQQTTDNEIKNRKGVRLTVTILAAVAVAFYLLTFLK